jgi:hypothetical protein
LGFLSEEQLELAIQMVISMLQVTVTEAKAQLSCLLYCESAPSAQPRPMECSRVLSEASPQACACCIWTRRTSSTPMPACAAQQLGLAARLINKPEPGSGSEPTGSRDWPERSSWVDAKRHQAG